MNIAFDAKRYFNNHTGLGNYSRDLVRILAEHIPQHQYYLFVKQQQKTYSVPENVSVITAEHLSLFWRSYAIAHDLKRNHMNLFHGLSNEIPFGLHARRIPSVVTIHDVIFKRYPQYYRLPDRLIYDFKTSYACRHADKIIATSQQTKEDLIQYYQVKPEAVEVVYQVCNPLFSVAPAQHNAFSQQTTGFLYVSSFQQRKNHLMLIRAFAAIAGKTTLNLTLAGRSGETYASCVALTEKLGMTQRIRFITDLPTEQLPQLYHSASVFVYPSLFEGFGIPLLEAMQCRLPIACSNIKVFHELAENAASYFEPEDFIDMGQAMLKASAMHKPDAENLYQPILSRFGDQHIAMQLNNIYTGL